MTVASIRPQPQRGTHDCCIAAFATLTGLDYEDVLEKAVKVGATPRKGFHTREIVALAKALKLTLVRRMGRSFNEWDDVNGFVAMRISEKPEQDHLMVLFEGNYFDPDGGIVWLREEYHRQNPKARVLWVYVHE